MYKARDKLIYNSKNVKKLLFSDEGKKFIYYFPLELIFIFIIKKIPHPIIIIIYLSHIHISPLSPNLSLLPTYFPFLIPQANTTLFQFFNHFTPPILFYNYSHIHILIKQAFSHEHQQ